MGLLETKFSCENLVFLIEIIMKLTKAKTDQNPTLSRITDFTVRLHAITDYNSV
jgi:hypothetical protein